MKLVELLARELSEWPDGCTVIWQSAMDLEIYFDGCNHKYTEGSVAADDRGYEGSHITRAQWQAERDKQKCGEWKRHRGGKQPVENRVRVQYKLRCGETGECASEDLMWDHQKGESDVMQYRIISQPQADEVEVKDTTIGTISYKISVDQIAGPLAWRDTIIHCQAIIEDCEREILANTQQLADEGFLLIAPITDVRAGVMAVDMSDPENWQEGDIVVCMKEEGSYAVLAAGKEYTLRISEDDLGLVDEEGDHMCACLTNGQLEFVRRP